MLFRQQCNDTEINEHGILYSLLSDAYHTWGPFECYEWNISWWQQDFTNQVIVNLQLSQSVANNQYINAFQCVTRVENFKLFYYGGYCTIAVSIILPHTPLVA